MHPLQILNILRERREGLEVTQEQLADISGVSLRTIKQIEVGKGNPTLQTLEKLSDVLGMELRLELKKMTANP